MAIPHVRWISHLLLAASLAMAAPLLAQDRGRILSISPERSSYKAEEEVQVWVEVQNQGRARRQLIALNLVDAKEKAVYDSHAVGQDAIFDAAANERQRVSFKFRLPANIRRGQFTLIAGYREFPWEPLIAFQGAAWCPPVRTLRVN